ncbi:phosphoribosyltransferase-like protein [Flavobacterium bizetiae]|uniref:phosphoribosyltransferase-like protein n=1 Tax=Flavobacterium bizetiae TaxID=2704140 RepID=UPI003756F4F5
MGHTFELNKQSLQRVEYLLPRLKHSISPNKVIRWLENFDKEEVGLALDLLSVFEYIPFNEFMFRLNDLLYEIFRYIPKGEKIVIFPYGKVGKSGTLVTYPLKNTNAFKNREEYILLTHDYENIINPSSFNHIIFLDDFIGSGKTFCKEFSRPDYIQKWINDNNIENIHILTSVIMAEGKKYISDRFPNINIVAEERNKIFHKVLSPLNALKKRQALESLALKHGETISVLNYPPYIAPLGYDKSESLISYFHCTPNNTLSIIWAKSKDWFPLFPRMANIRMNEAREFKKDIAFYIGICNRLGIDLYTGNSIIEKKNNSDVRIINHNTKQDHSVIALLTLKNEGYDNLMICHILGLTREELKLVYTEARKLGFTDRTYNISNDGIQFLKELKRKTRKENFRKESNKNLEIKKTLYLPDMFNGFT